MVGVVQLFVGVVFVVVVVCCCCGYLHYQCNLHYWRFCCCNCSSLFLISKESLVTLLLRISISKELCCYAFQYPKIALLLHISISKESLIVTHFNIQRKPCYALQHPKKASLLRISSTILFSIKGRRRFTGGMLRLTNTCFFVFIDSFLARLLF